MEGRKEIKKDCLNTAIPDAFDFTNVGGENRTGLLSLLRCFWTRFYKK
jgi:hypothetical protein